MMTLPVRSGMSLAPQVGFGGKDCAKTDSVPPMCFSGEDGTREQEGAKKMREAPQRGDVRCLAIRRHLLCGYEGDRVTVYCLRISGPFTRLSG